METLELNNHNQKGEGLWDDLTGALNNVRNAINGFKDKLLGQDNVANDKTLTGKVEETASAVMGKVEDLYEMGKETVSKTIEGTGEALETVKDTVTDVAKDTGLIKKDSPAQAPPSEYILEGNEDISGTSDLGDKSELIAPEPPSMSLGKEDSLKEATALGGMGRKRKKSKKRRRSIKSMKGTSRKKRRTYKKKKGKKSKK